MIYPKYLEGKQLVRKPVTAWSIYYGWVIVGLAFLSMAFWTGIRTAFAVFYVALLDEFSWSRGDAAGVQSTAYIIYVILAPIAGGLIDRFGPRRVILPGILLLSVGLVLSAFTHSLLQFYLFYGIVVGVGITFISIVTYSPLLARWFERKRGAANGFAASGMGLGTFLLVPFAQYLISSWGWRLSFVGLAVMVFIILFPTNLLFLRAKPDEKDLDPEGFNKATIPEKKMEKIVDQHWAGTDWTLHQALRTGRYWALVAFPFFIVTGIYLMLFHSVQFLVDQGFDNMLAAFLLALVGIISLPSKIFWGWLSDHIGREKAFTGGAFFVSMAACFLILIEMTKGGKLAYLFALSLGLGWGAAAPMFLSVSADLFQGRQFGLIYGILEGVIGGGCAFGAWVAGYIFDQTQSYFWAFVLAASVSILSCIFVWLSAPRKVRRCSPRRIFPDHKSLREQTPSPDS